MFICIAFRVNVILQEFNFEKIYLYSRTKTLLLPGSFETKKETKRHFVIKKIRNCTTLCQFVVRNTIMLKLSFKKPETGAQTPPYIPSDILHT